MKLATQPDAIDQTRLMELVSALRVPTERGEPIRMSVFDERGLIGEAWLPDTRNLPIRRVLN